MKMHFKKCGVCDRNFTRAQWYELPVKGITARWKALGLDGRDCLCGNTLCITLPHFCECGMETLNKGKCSACYAQSQL